MKCPKCGYLGFDRVECCRNCGYDFSPRSSVPDPDLSLRSGTRSIEPLDDLSLVDAATARPPARTSGIVADPDHAFGEPEDVGPATAAPPAPSVRAAPIRPGGELPLFGPPIPDDQPLITRASPPRPPLAVRRSTPEVAKPRAGQPRPATFDLAFDLDSSASTPGQMPGARGGKSQASEDSWSDDDALPDAGVGARFLAVVIDLLILMVIDAVVVYFTMKICGVDVKDIDVLPKAPLLAFLFAQNCGYLVAFTAGGQTLGKMAVGIRVVPEGDGSSLDLGRAFLRTLMWLLLAVPAGLGFVTTLFSRDHRGLHDRFAGTRVVRATA
jgi:uncharacterized RDD family membrane protein YckC